MIYGHDAIGLLMLQIVHAWYIKKQNLKEHFHQIRQQCHDQAQARIKSNTFKTSSGL